MQRRPVNFPRHPHVLLVVLLLLAPGISPRAVFPAPEPARPASVDSISSVPVGRPLVALTYDDGPRHPYTGQVLSLLRDQGVRATFFLIGENVRRYPELARRIVREGHAVGNHSWSHRSMESMPRQGVADEIRRADEAIRQATGVWPSLFRPPYGAMGSALRGPHNVAAERGHDIVLWSVEVGDWSTGSPLRVAVRALRRVRPGSIVLLHDGGGDRSHTVTATRWMLGHLAREGYEMVTVPELLRAGR